MSCGCLMWIYFICMCFVSNQEGSSVFLWISNGGGFQETTFLNCGQQRNFVVFQEIVFFWNKVVNWDLEPQSTVSPIMAMLIPQGENVSPNKHAFINPYSSIHRKGRKWNSNRQKEENPIHLPVSLSPLQKSYSTYTFSNTP